MRLLILLLLLWQPGQALAHAALIQAWPDDGARLEASPDAVRLRFDEPVGLIALGLVGPQGPVHPLEAPAVSGDVLAARFPPGLPRGTYLLSWRVTSVDSHPVAGTIVFGVGVAPAAQQGNGAGERWLAASMAVRAAFLATLLVGAGAALFRAVAEPPCRIGLSHVAWAGVALAVVQIGLRGALLADTPLAWWGAAVWRLGLGTTLATSLAVSGLGLAVSAVTLRTGRGARWWGVAGALLAVAGLPLSGHAGTAEPRWLTAPALGLHGMAAAFWVGALVPLLLGLRLGLVRDGGLAALQRFSAAAVAGVAVLVVSGTALAAVQLGGWAGLWTTYGGVLAGKLALVAVMLALAGANRWVLVPALERAAATSPAGRPAPARGARRWLRASIAAEVVLALCVLGMTGVLGLTPPPRSAAEAVREQGDRAAWMTAGGVEATMAVSPGRVGPNRFTLVIGRATPPLEVTLELRQAAAGVAAVRRPMRLVDGAWTYEGPELAVPGRWRIGADALLTEFEQTSFSTEMDIQ